MLFTTVFCCLLLILAVYYWIVPIKHLMAENVTINFINFVPIQFIGVLSAPFRQDGGFFAFPPNFSISLRNLLKVTDCVGHEAGGAGPASSSKLTVTQEVMDTCLARYPHV